ncbi:MAG: PAS domain S-box protein, partial [Desulfobacula sp.]|nr:PAS domain S-box protein [Desulfobacula sp.]
GSWEWNFAGNSFIFSNEMCRIFKIDQTKQVSTIWDVLEKKAHPEDKKHFSSQMKKKWLMGKGKKITYRFIRNDGRLRWIDAMPPEIKKAEKDGTPLSIIGTIQDVTQYKQTEENLQKSENRYQLIAENISDVIWVLDMNFHNIYVSPSIYHQRGYTAEELSKIPLSERTTQKSFKKVKKLFNEKIKLIKDGDPEGWEPSFFEIDQFCKDGTTIWTSNSIRFLPGPDKQPVNIIGSTQDITERKHALDALKESEEKYRTIMESMDDSTYICSTDFHIEYMNPAMIKRVGYDAIGELCYKTVYGREERCPWCVFDKIVKGESINHELASPKDGKVYQISNSPVFHTDASVSKLTVFRDVTEFKKMESNLQQAQKMESIGKLAGGIAHDFNNILFPIIGHTEMLIEDVPEGSPFKEGLKQIYISALRASELVKQILTFSRQESGELELMKMQTVIREALKLIRSSIPTTIDIKQNINPDCGVIKADPTQIHQIVMNLSTNAFHAMEETGGVLEVSLEEIKLKKSDLFDPHIKPGVYACLTISDTGKGMKNELIKKIFDPFFTTKETGKGTGMGLSVVHGIVKSMNGTIKIYSEPGKGSDFHVYLPLAEKMKEQQLTNAETSIQGGTEHIFLVDDEKSIIGMEQNMLERLGYQVTSRSSSIDALEAFRANPDKYDLVITDMQMPNMSGDRLSVELKKIRPDIPILLCTGFSETMSEEQAASLGINGFLLKPIVKKDLSHKIREVLD